MNSYKPKDMDAFEEFDAKSQIKGKKYMLPFGKHKGKTVAELLEEDPQYLLWLNGNTSVALKKKVLKKAIKLAQMRSYLDLLDWSMCSYEDLY